MLHLHSQIHADYKYKQLPKHIQLEVTKDIQDD